MGLTVRSSSFAESDLVIDLSLPQSRCQCASKPMHVLNSEGENGLILLSKIVLLAYRRISI